MANVFSTIKLKRHTSSANYAPVELSEGEFAINLIDGNFYYGGLQGNNVLQNFAFNEFTASKIFVPGTGSITMESGSITIQTGSITLATGSEISSTSGSFGVVSASKYVGIPTSTTYQTGSDPTSSLNNLKILNFDSQIFVTSDSSSGQLTLQFGFASLPDQDFSSTYNTDRFSLQAQAYTLTSTFNTVAGVSVISQSFQATKQFAYGAPDPSFTLSTTGSIADPLTVNTASYSLNAFTQPDALFITGDLDVTSSLFVVDGAGVSQTIVVSASLDLNKINPGATRFTNYDVTGLSPGGAEYVTNTGSETANTNISIERGVSGSITWVGVAGVANGWTLDNVVSGSPRTITRTGTYSGTNAWVRATWTSSQGAGSDGFDQYIATTIKAINSRPISVRTGASTSSSFSQGELGDNEGQLTHWLNGVGVEDGHIYFNQGTSNLVTSVTNSSAAYLYIVMDDDVTITDIVNAGGFSELGNFNSPVTVGPYKYYRTQFQNGADEYRFVINPA